MSYQRKAEDNRRLHKTYEETKRSYGPGVWYNERKERYCRLNFTNSWLKRHCSKVTRKRLKRTRVIVSSKSYYKRFYDYWWELY